MLVTESFHPSLHLLVLLIAVAPQTDPQHLGTLAETDDACYTVDHKIATRNS